MGRLKGDKEGIGILRCALVNGMLVLLKTDNNVFGNIMPMLVIYVKKNA